MTPVLRRLSSIQVVLIGSFLLVAGLAVGSLAAQRYFWLTGVLHDEQATQDLLLARSVAAGLERYITLRRHLVDTLADEVAALGLRDRARIAELVETSNRRDLAFLSLLVVDATGRAVAVSPTQDAEGRPNAGRRYDDRRWFEEVRAGRRATGAMNVVVGRATGQPTVTVAAPIRSRSGEVVGAVAGGLNLDQLRASVHDIVPSPAVNVAIVDATGHVIVHPVREWEAEARDLSRAVVFRSAQRGVRDAASTAPDRETSVSSYVRMPSTGWVVWTERPPEYRSAGIAALVRDITLSSLLALAVSAGAALVVARTLSRPIRALAGASREVSAGRAEALRLSPRPGFRVREVAELEEAFARMADALREQYRDLETRVADRTRDLAQATRDAQRINAALRAQDVIRGGYAELAALLNSLDRSHILQEGTRKIAATLRAPLAAVYLTENGPGSLRLKTYAAADGGLLDTRLLSPAGLPVTVAESREPVVLTPRDGDEALRLRTGVGELVVAAVVGFPLAYRERLLGVLVVALLDPLSEEARGFLDSGARQLSVALSNAGLFESVRHQAQQLEGLNLALQRASEAKSRFLSSMSHELRTPLNAIIGFTDLLLMSGRDPLSDRQRMSLEKVRDSGRHLLGLINQVLELAKIEAGRVDVEVEAFALDTLVQECLAAVEAQATAKGLEIQADGLGDVPCLEQDRPKVKQILLNLLSNAVKFTPAGRVHVGVTAEDDEMCAIAVADSGIGIRPEDHHLIFEEFRQVAHDGQDPRHGTGLGLAISRHLATLLGGTLGVDSSPGRGSVFTLRVPIRYRLPEPEPVPEPEPGPPASHASGRVLVVDDDRTVVDMIRDALAGEGVTVAWAASARDGLVRARADSPDVVVLDVMLQGEADGWDVLRTLKADPATRGIHVLMHSVIDNPERARRLGADGVLTKPFSAEAVQTLLQSLGTTVTRASS